MQISIFVSQIAAIVYFAVGVGILLNEAFYRKIVDDFIKNPESTFIGSFFTIVLGWLIIFYSDSIRSSFLQEDWSACNLFETAAF